MDPLSPLTKLWDKITELDKISSRVWWAGALALATAASTYYSWRQIEWAAFWGFFAFILSMACSAPLKKYTQRRNRRRSLHGLCEEQKGALRDSLESGKRGGFHPDSWVVESLVAKEILIQVPNRTILIEHGWLYEFYISEWAWNYLQKRPELLSSSFARNDDTSHAG